MFATRARKMTSKTIMAERLATLGILLCKYKWELAFFSRRLVSSVNPPQPLMTQAIKEKKCCNLQRKNILYVTTEMAWPIFQSVILLFQFFPFSLFYINQLIVTFVISKEGWFFSADFSCFLRMPCQSFKLWPSKWPSYYKFSMILSVASSNHWSEFQLNKDQFGVDIRWRANTPEYAFVTHF
jgi:hypothetical protein